MKKVIILTTGILALLFIYGTYNFVLKDDVKMQEVALTENNEEIVIKLNEQNLDKLERELPFDMSEAEVQTAIHHMSHQKIKASKKWGSMPLTQERVERLIEIVEKSDYEHESTYLSILNKWKHDDFSSSVQAHNFVWDLQNGTVGRAHDLLTAEEEKQFIKKHFDLK